MASLYFITGTPGHEVEVGRFEGSAVSSQAWARCECGWSQQDCMFNLTSEAAAAHVKEMRRQARHSSAETAAP